MKLRCLMMAAIISLCSIAARADSCAAGSYDTIRGTSCTIGDLSFTFAPTSLTILADPSTITFTPISAPGLAGFIITGMPGSASYDNGDDSLRLFTGQFTAAPLSGTVYSINANLNGVDQFSSNNPAAGGNDQSYVELAYGGASAIDIYNSSLGVNTETISRGESIDPASYNGNFALSNGSSGVGTASFASADFFFTVPDASEVPLLILTALGIFLFFIKKAASASSVF